MRKILASLLFLSRLMRLPLEGNVFIETRLNVNSLAVCVLSFDDWL